MYRKITMASVPKQYSWPNKIQQVSRTQTFFETYRREFRGLLVIGLLFATCAAGAGFLFDFKLPQKKVPIAVTPEAIRTDIKPGDTIYVQQGAVREFRKVIALPGDTVQIRKGTVLVNGSPVEAKAAYLDAIMLLNGSSYFAVEEKPAAIPHNPISSIYKHEQIIGRIPQTAP